MNRRELFQALAAGAIITAEGLWFPGTKLISIPVPSNPNSLITPEQMAKEMIELLAKTMMQTKKNIAANVYNRAFT